MIFNIDFIERIGSSKSRVQLYPSSWPKFQLWVLWLSPSVHRSHLKISDSQMKLYTIVDSTAAKSKKFSWKCRMVFQLIWLVTWKALVWFVLFNFADKIWAMSSFLYQRPIQNPILNPYPGSLRSSTNSQRPFSIFSPCNPCSPASSHCVVGVFWPLKEMPRGLFSSTKRAFSKWRHYTLSQALSFAAKNGTVIVCAMSQLYLPFLNNWL